MKPPIYTPKRRYKPFTTPADVSANGRVRVYPRQHENNSWAAQVIWVRVLMPCFIRKAPVQEGDKVCMSLRDYVEGRGKGLYARLGKRVDVCGTSVILFTEVPQIVDNAPLLNRLHDNETVLYQGAGHATFPAPRELKSPKEAKTIAAEIKASLVAKRNDFIEASLELKRTPPSSPRFRELELQIQALRVDLRRLGDCGCQRRKAMRQAIQGSVRGATLGEAEEVA